VIHDQFLQISSRRTSGGLIYDTETGKALVEKQAT
jgi:hypothetical protein